MSDTTQPSDRQFPTALEIVQAHRPVLRRIVDALVKGTEHAQEYFVWMDEDLDTALAPALVRKGAKRALKESGADVSNEEDENPQPNGEPEFLSNLGLAMRADGVRIRILRSDGGKVPVAGPSKQRRAFYSQQLCLPLYVDDDAVPVVIDSPITNLVLHWETNGDYTLTNVYLALPLAGQNTRDSVETEWNEIVWRRQAVYIDGVQVLAETVDLDIHLDGEQSGTA